MLILRFIPSLFIGVAKGEAEGPHFTPLNLKAKVLVSLFLRGGGYFKKKSYKSNNLKVLTRQK